MKKSEILLLVGVFFVDQVTKMLVASKMALYDSIVLIKGFFNITYVNNTGAAWSMMEGQMVFFFVVTLLALVGVGYYFVKTDKTQWVLRYALVLILAGTLGNFVDRLSMSAVRDFLDFVIFGYNFPVFNVADVSLCVGVGLLAVDALFLDKEAIFKKEGNRG